MVQTLGRALSDELFKVSPHPLHFCNLLVELGDPGLGQLPRPASILACIERQEFPGSPRA